MSFLHVLGSILGVASKVVPLLPLPGPVGVIIGAGLSVAGQEATGNSGEVKRATASAEIGAMTPDHPNKAQIISKILEGFVMVFNGVAELFPPEVKAEKT